MLKRALVTLLCLQLLLFGADAQTPGPGQLGLVVATPNVVQVLDSTKNWSTIGTINSTTHVFTPVSGGGGGTPGGTSPQIQYNNSGAFGGFTASGDATITPSTGAVAVTKTGGVAFGSLATLTPIGTGVATALGVNVGTAGSFIVNGGALGTPSSGTLTNATGLPVAGITGLGGGVGAALGTAVNGTGAISLTTSPTFVTPILGTPTSVTLTNATGLPIAGITGLGSGVPAALALTANGTGAISLTTSPVFVTPALGTPASGVLTNATGLPISTGVSGLGTGVAAALAANLNAAAGVAAAAAPLTAANGAGSLSGAFGYFICTTGGACTITLPTPAAGFQFCIRNDDAIATVITIAAISSVSFEKTNFNGYGTSGTGTMVSGGAVGDKVCLIGRDATHYLVGSYVGTWTNN